MKNVTYSIEIHDDYAELSETGRQTPLALRRAEPEYIAEMMRQAAYKLLERAFYLDHNGDFVPPDFDRDERTEQVFKMTVENAPIEYL